MYSDLEVYALVITLVCLCFIKKWYFVMREANKSEQEKRKLRDDLNEISCKYIDELRQKKK